MIDVENQVFTRCYTALQNAGVDNVVGVTVLSPSEFPCVCIEQTDSYVYEQGIDSSSNENNAVIVYEVNVFSNKKSGKKAEAKSIFAIVDQELNNLGFVRNTCNPILLNDSTKYRLFGRYTGVVDKNEKIYRR